MDVDKLSIKQTGAGFVVIDFSEADRRIGSSLVFAEGDKKRARESARREHQAKILGRSF
jgi:hypothetical protein